MPDPRYRPGHRRKPKIALALDSAAGVLVGILLTILASAGVSLFIPPGAERFSALVISTMIAWPIGGGLGVWLSMGPPLKTRVLGWALAASILASAVLALPIWLAPESVPVRVLGIVAVGLLGPCFTRLVANRARQRSD